MAAQKKQNLSSEKLLQLAQEVMLELLTVLADRENLEVVLQTPFKISKWFDQPS